MGVVKLKQVYEPYEFSDGYRILIDRVWPRNIPKQKSRIDQWVPDIAPTDKLRKWFHQNPAKKWRVFQTKYKREILFDLEKKKLFISLRRLVRETEILTLLYTAQDTEKNNAVVLKKMLLKKYLE